MWKLPVCLGLLLVGVDAFIAQPSLSVRRSLRASEIRGSNGARSSTSSCTSFVAQSSAITRARCSKGGAITMSSDFEDEKAKKLRAMLNRQFGIGENSRPDEWCKSTDTLEAGTVLLADPKPFTGTGDKKVYEKFGLAKPLPSDDSIPPDRAADLLPVVLLLDVGERGAMGVMINRRTGVLMGDLGSDFKTFMIQPLWLGGTNGDNQLSFIHTYPEVASAKPLLEEQGLFFGGDMESASRLVTDGPGSGFNFRFFIQFTRWAPGELEAEVEQGLWRLAVPSKMSLLRVRDRKGPDVAKPLWTDLSEMAGGDHLRTMEEFYRR